ncbi:hypothetical protein WCE55_05060 [Luteimonas sp. MJ293]|uniref:hypothetical protein n=1 Tax=Luteimonas sp. MJ146 TaxID=3129240 RepID=UPI0031BB2FFF
MTFYHVIAKTAAEDKFHCLFSDLSVVDLKKKFVRPYELGRTFFSGNDLFSPSDLRAVQIVRTPRPDQVERDEINRKDREHINKINRESPHVFFVSVGGGYSPEDIAQAGDDVTHSFIKGPPGFKSGKFMPSFKVLSWVGGIAAAVIAAGLAKWLGWV